MDLLMDEGGSLAMADTEKAEVLKCLRNSRKDDGANSPPVAPGNISRGNAHRLHHGVFRLGLRKKESGAV